MLVKKIAEDWFPTEKPDLKVGQMIDITDPYWLIRQGKAVAAEVGEVEFAPKSQRPVEAPVETEKPEEKLPTPKAL